MKKLLLTGLMLTSIGSFAQESSELLESAYIEFMSDQIANGEFDCSDIHFPEYRGLKDIECAAQKNWDLNKVNNLNQTALVIAADKGHINATKLLVSLKGVDLNSRDRGGYSPLIHAASKGHCNIAKALINAKGIDLNLTDYAGRTALMYAVAFGNNNTAKLLINERNTDINKETNEGKTALFYADLHGNGVAVRALFKRGVHKTNHSIDEIEAIKAEYDVE